ncbi:hypothetical protein pb186bvf_001522 [Paramecium bursaria]
MLTLLKSMKPLYNYVKPLHVTERFFQDISNKDLLSPHYIKKLMEKPIQKRTIMSQFGLWHGKQPKTGYQTCFSEKKSRRTWMPNIQQKMFYSDILGMQLRTRASTKALRCIRKCGSFDNYILLTKPKDLDSVYGEYLRKLMLTKINDPFFQVKGILKGRQKNITRRQVLNAKKPPAVWFPLEIRHKDLTFLRPKVPQNMTPKELRKFNELTKMSEKEFPPELIKKGDDAMDEFLRKKNKEMIRITLIAVQEAQDEEFENQ